MNGRVEKTWAIKPGRGDRDIEVPGWAVIIMDEKGNEIEPYARLYENIFMRKRDAKAALARRVQK